MEVVKAQIGVVGPKEWFLAIFIKLTIVNYHVHKIEPLIPICPI